MDVAIEYGKKQASHNPTLSSRAETDRGQGKDIDDQVDHTLDRLLVEFGKEILKIVPGKVSTEVDARFSFDKDASIRKARHIIEVSCCQN